MSKQSSGFSKASDREAWLDLVARIVTAEDPERELAQTTDDAVSLPPLCQAANPREAADYPGCPPWRRGASAAQGVEGWDIRPQLACPDPEVANAAIREEIDQGATSVTLRLDAALARGCVEAEAIVAYDLTALDRVLRDIPIDLVTLTLDCGERFAEGSALLLALAERRGIASTGFRAELSVDPLGCIARGARLGHDAALASATDLSLHVQERWPGVVPLVADGSPYHEAGATAAQELACVMASALCYLRRLEATGMRIDEAFRGIGCTVVVDADLFAGIAKLRALRELWARVAELCGVPDVGGPRLRAVTSRRAIDDHEPWTNLLRSTIAASAAALGGADSLTVLPIDRGGALEPGTVRRLSRTAQLVLQEEGRLGAVIDPAGGSGYVEMLTDGLCAKAWDTLMAIEGAGGMLEALCQGSIQAMVADAWRERRHQAATRTQVLVGTNRFVVPEQARADHGRRPAGDELQDLRQRLAASDRAGRSFVELLGAAADGTFLPGPPTQPSQVQPLGRHTLDEDWSRVRRRGGAALAKPGARPTVFLANLGPTAQHAERLAWTRDLLMAGGIEPEASTPILSLDGVASTMERCTCPVCVIVTGGTPDMELARAVAAAARALGATRVDLSAGGELDDSGCASIGATQAVRDGQDLVAWLDALHDILGSPPTAAGEER